MVVYAVGITELRVLSDSDYVKVQDCTMSV